MLGYGGRNIEGLCAWLVAKAFGEGGTTGKEIVREGYDADAIDNYEQLISESEEVMHNN